MSGATRPELPLFPLRAVLFPDGLIDLKIFEARYLDLMSRCLREARPFGVVGLKSGSEGRASGEAVELYEVGTLAELIAVDSAQAGILLVRCRGTRRFMVGPVRQQADGLWLATATEAPDDPLVAPGPLREKLATGLAEAITRLIAQGARPFPEPHRFDSAGWVANRWCEILPLPLDLKQRLLALADPVARLDIVAALIRGRQAEH